MKSPRMEAGSSRSNELRGFVENYCSRCENFVAEEANGVGGNIEPRTLGVPDAFIDELKKGSRPYEYRVCDEAYEPDGKGGCKNFVQGKIPLFKDYKRVIDVKPV